MFTLAERVSSKIRFPVQFVRLLSAMANPRVFFDITADGCPLGRIIMEVSDEREV